MEVGHDIAILCIKSSCILCTYVRLLDHQLLQGICKVKCMRMHNGVCVAPCCGQLSCGGTLYRACVKCAACLGMLLVAID